MDYVIKQNEQTSLEPSALESMLVLSVVTTGGKFATTVLDSSVGVGIADAKRNGDDNDARGT
jgi:hypothetical protein